MFERTVFLAHPLIPILLVTSPSKFHTTRTVHNFLAPIYNNRDQSIRPSPRFETKRKGPISDATSWNEKATSHQRGTILRQSVSYKKHRVLFLCDFPILLVTSPSKFHTTRTVHNFLAPIYNTRDQSIRPSPWFKTKRKGPISDAISWNKKAISHQSGTILRQCVSYKKHRVYLLLVN